MNKLNRINNRMRKTAGFPVEDGISRSTIYVYGDCVSVEVMELGESSNIIGISWDGNYCVETEKAQEFITILSAAISDVQNKSFKQ